MELTPEQFTAPQFGKTFHHILDEIEYHFEFNPEYFFPVWRDLMKSGLAKTWESKGALLCATFVPDLYSGNIQGAVVLWGTLPENRGNGGATEVFSAFEKYAGEGGFPFYAVAHSKVDPEKRMGFFQSRGLNKIETVFRKD